MAKGPVSFGSHIRAYRLGWGKSGKHGCFIRMSDSGPGATLIELCPLNDIPNKKLKGLHRCWWDNPGIVDMIPWLKGVKEIKTYIAVVIDDDGKIVKQLTGRGR